MLEALLDGHPKVTTVRRPWIKDGLALFPWEWSRTALDQVEKLYNNGRVEVAIGHWDLQSFGGDDSHICPTAALKAKFRSEEHTSELQSLMRISSAVFCWQKKTQQNKYI